jgi:C-terminal processing protease CtpA/Prc
MEAQMKPHMLYRALLALACCSTANLPGQVNLDFKQGQLGEAPAGWRLTAAAGYSLKLTDQCSKPQSRCAVLRSEGPSTAEAAGIVQQSFDAAPYHNKVVRFRAAVRVESQYAARAQLWFRVDRPGGQKGFFDNMGNRPIVSSAWRSYDILGEVDGDATNVYVGMILTGGGAAYIGDASIEVIGEFQSAPVLEQSRPLSPRGLQNLVAYARLFGYVRHFHPSDQAAAADWDTLAIAGVRAAEDAKDPAELAQKLQDFFRPVAPTLRVFPAAQAAPKIDLNPPAGAGELKQIAWRHLGFGTGRVGYHSARVSSSPPGGSLPPPLDADLGGGVRALLPMALFADDAGTLPHAPAAEKNAAVGATPAAPVRIRYSADDRAVRLADAIIAWNISQHFYPYFDVVKTDWPKALTDALTAAAADKNAAAFGVTLRKLVAQLHDGHGSVYGPGQPHSPLPLAWDWVENQLVIAAVPDAQGQPIKPGDAVMAINGKPIKQAISDAEAVISAATPQWRRVRLLEELTAGTPGESLALEIEPFGQPGKRETVVLQRKSPPSRLDREPRPETVAELKPGVWYVDLTRMNDDDWKAALPRITEATGLIFDMRGYPARLMPVFLQHLSDKPMTSAQGHFPVVTVPDRREMKFERRGGWDLKPLEPYLGMKKAFLTDGRAISYGESCMGIVEHYKLAEIVGGPTAGTNGNTEPFNLPGGYRVRFTGMKVLKHDGSQHHGIGILPTVPVSRTRAGVAAGRDEVLERALELFK